MPVTGLIGAYGGMLAGTSVVDKGEIPYRPEALVQRDANREDWTNLDPAAKCYIPGIPRQPMPAHSDPANRYGDFYCLRMGQQQPQYFHG